jgi:hypothetical protein
VAERHRLGLVVRDVAGVRGLEPLDGVLEDAQLALREADPERDRRRVELGRRLGRRRPRLAGVSTPAGAPQALTPTITSSAVAAAVAIRFILSSSSPG